MVLIDYEEETKEETAQFCLCMQAEILTDQQKKSFWEWSLVNGLGKQLCDLVYFQTSGKHFHWF